MVCVTTAQRFFSHYLGVRVSHERPLRPAEWLAIPEQNLRSVMSGRVWHDGTGELTSARRILPPYPDYVWRYLLVAQWRRIWQEEPFPGRCAEASDDLGSRVVAARLVRELMHLAFLLERQYMPCSKWLGTGFSRLRCAATLEPALLGALAATSWLDRERHLSVAYETLATMRNATRLAEPVEDKVSPFLWPESSI